MRRLSTYSTVGIRQSLYELRHIGARRREADKRAAFLLERFREDQSRIAEILGKELVDLSVLEIGPGQVPVRASVLALQNEVTGIDLDMLPGNFDVLGYVGMLRRNGAGRVAKTVLRRLLGIDRAERQAWCKALGVERLGTPKLIRGDIQAEPPQREAFDVAVSWSVFEHLPDPAAAIRHVTEALKPGGVLYLGIHLYTSNSGHHDIRSFSGRQSDLPPWGHLRPGEQHHIRPSAFLNRLRLEEWRTMFAEICPGYDEFLSRNSDGELLQQHGLREELSEYSDEELTTTDVFFRWRKP